MSLHTGGFALGEMLTRSRSASSASFCASLEDITPSWLPSSATNLTSGSLICSLMSGSFAIGFPSYRRNPPYWRLLLFPTNPTALHSFSRPTALRFCLRSWNFTYSFGFCRGPFSRLCTPAPHLSSYPPVKSGQHTLPAKIPTNTLFARYLTMHTLACR